MVNNDSYLAITTWMDDSDSSELILKVQKILKPIYFEIEEFNFNKTTHIFGNLNKFDYVFGKSALSTRSQVYKMLRTLEILKIIENLQNKKYKIVFKSRPDLFFNSKINTNISEEIYFESTIGDWKKDRSDRFFYASRGEYVRFVNSMKDFGKISWNENSMYPIYDKIPLQEQFIKYCCEKGNFKSNLFFPITKVWRPESEPKFKDIIKIFFKRFYKYLVYIKKKELICEKYLTLIHIFIFCNYITIKSKAIFSSMIFWIYFIWFAIIHFIPIATFLLMPIQI